MRLILAPVRGVTDAAFRSNFARVFGGFDGAIAPFIAPRGGKVPRPSELRQVLPDNNLLPSVPQILTKNPEAFRATAHGLADAGCEEVNWNLGCPFPHVVKKGHGSGLLPYPDRVAAFLDTVLVNAPLRVSIKMRLGLRDPSESLAVIEVLDRFPLSEVIVHARTAAQMYEGAVNLPAFLAVASKTRHPIVYNGDVVSVAGLRRFQAQLPFVESWMIGRGALADPFLACEIRSGAIEPSKKLPMLREFHDAMFRHYEGILSGPTHVLHKMKGIWSYLGGSFESGDRLWKKVRKAQSMRRYLDAVDAILGGEVKWMPREPGLHP